MPLLFARHSVSIAPFDVDLCLRRAVQSRWLGVVIVVAAVIQQALGHMNCDTSWFMTFADKVLAGAVPYVDVSDPNPPAAFLAYMPALLLAHLTGGRPELIVDMVVFVGAVLSMWSAGQILHTNHLLRSRDLWPAFSAVSYVLLVVPAFCFAEREHCVVILLLPVLAVCAARLSGANVTRHVGIAAGLAAGLALTFKPYYLLPFGLAVLCAPIRRRDWRLLLTAEVWSAVAIVGLYGLGIAWFFPAYVRDVLPLATEIYAAAREPLRAVVEVPAFIVNVWLLLALLWILGRHRWDPRVVVLVAASIGFLATYLIQSKGWMNHAYPGVALALIAGTFVLLSNDASEREGRGRFARMMFLPVLVAAPFFFGAAIDLTNGEEYPGLRAEVERLAPPHPKLAALAEELDVAHPLVRQIGGTWIGQQNCLWIGNTIRYLLATRGGALGANRRAHLLELEASDERIFVADVSREKPDVLLVETPALEQWARTAPTTRGLFASYRRAGQAGEVSIWLRRPG